MQHRTAAVPAFIRRALAFAILACASFTAAAGAFGVSPIRVDLDPATRSAIITVANDDDRKLYFQAKLFSWTQSAAGDDRLEENGDLIFFPQIFTVDAKDKRLVRVGVKSPPAGDERAFRLFIEEMPDPNEPAAGGAQIAVRLRFGVPVFVSSGKGEARPEIEPLDGAKGALRVAIRNSGDRQIRFEELSARAGDRVVAKTAGWYVFPGVTRAFSIPVAREDCPLPRSLEIRAVADGKEVRRTIDVPAAVCAP